MAFDKPRPFHVACHEAAASKAGESGQAVLANGTWGFFYIEPWVKMIQTCGLTYVYRQIGIYNDC